MVKAKVPKPIEEAVVESKSSFSDWFIGYHLLFYSCRWCWRYSLFRDWACLVMPLMKILLIKTDHWSLLIETEKTDTSQEYPVPKKSLRKSMTGYCRSSCLSCQWKKMLLMVFQLTKITKLLIERYHGQPVRYLNFTNFFFFKSKIIFINFMSLKKNFFSGSTCPRNGQVMFHHSYFFHSRCCQTDE